MGKGIIKLFGWLFLIAGIWGFFQNPVFGYFEVDLVHNIIHILTGLLALGASSTATGAKSFGKIFGIIYAIVAVVGFTMNGDTFFGIFHTNVADHYLHAVVAVVFLLVGFTGGGGEKKMPVGMPPQDSDMTEE